MSLVTIQRAPTPSESSETSSNNDSTSSRSQSEDFFTSNGAAVLQNQYGRRRSSVIRDTDSLQYCLKKTVQMLRKEDSLRLIIDLEKFNNDMPGHRCFCLISTMGNTDTDEFAILGIDIGPSKTTIGYVKPIYQDVSVALDGDGGFRIEFRREVKLFKPTSVHSLWTTVQLLNKACSIANRHNFYDGGLNHTWIQFYQNSINSTRAQVAEWNKMAYTDWTANSKMAPNSAIGEYVFGTEITSRREMEQRIIDGLKEVMRDEDMDNVTVISLRLKLQNHLNLEVIEYRSFIAEQILVIYGQMDESSEILPYLYLGSTYNASNNEELESKRVSHILNVTCESENFYREKYQYKNIEVLDKDETNLLNHFDTAHKFINEVKSGNTTCLVHCQRGISRSATIVISYIMKECNKNFNEAFNFVKSKRECIRPNDGFLDQLQEYEGMLNASSNRHNTKFRGQSRSEIKSFPNDNSECQLSLCSLPEELRRKSANDYLPLTNSDSTTVAKDYINSSSDVIDIQQDLLIYKNNSNTISNIIPEINRDVMEDDSNNNTEAVAFRRPTGSNDFEKRSFKLKPDSSWIVMKENNNSEVAECDENNGEDEEDGKDMIISKLSPMTQSDSIPNEDTSFSSELKEIIPPNSYFDPIDKS